MFENAFTPAVNQVFDLFENAGFEIRIVGGTVRDCLIGNPPKDIDFSTTATPSQMVDLLNNASARWEPTGLQHGTITLVIDGEPFEITTLRVDTNHDGRHADVEFTSDWQLDASRRDLTFNAMSMDRNGKIFDYFGGANDIELRKIQFVGNVNLRVQEDYLRIMRARRFATRFAFHIDADILETMRQHVDGLKYVSGERKWMEFSKFIDLAESTTVVQQQMSELDWHYMLGMPKTKPVFHAQRADPLYAKLASLCQNVDVLDHLRQVFKFDNAVYKGARALLEMNNDYKLLQGLNLQEHLLSSTYNTEYLKTWLTLHGKLDLVKRVELFESNPLPITGKDIIALGVVSGPDIGKRLNRANVAWVESDFTLSTQELLEVVA